MSKKRLPLPIPNGENSQSQQNGKKKPLPLPTPQGVEDSQSASQFSTELSLSPSTPTQPEDEGRDDQLTTPESAKTAPLDKIKEDLLFYRDFYGDDIAKGRRLKEFNEITETYNERLRTEAPPEEKIPFFKQEAFNEYVQTQIDLGNITQDEADAAIADNPSDVFRMVAISKTGLRQTDKGLEEIQDGSEWGPRFFGTETDLVEENMESAVSKQKQKEVDALAEKLKSKFIESLPEEKRDDKEYLEKIEDDLMLNHDTAIDLTGDNKWGAVKGTKLGDFAQGLGYSLEKFALNAVYYGTNNPALKPVIEARRDMVDRKKLENITQVEGDFLDAIKRGDTDGAARSSLNMIAESAPHMALAGVITSATGNPYLGYASIAASSAGEQYLNVKDEKWFEDLSSTEGLGYVVASGAFEAVGEMAGARIVTRSAKELLKASTRDAASQTLKQFFKGAALQMGVGLTEETLAESVTAIGQYTADAIAKGEDITVNEILDRGLRGAASGLGMAGGMTIGTTTAQTSVFAANKFGRNFSRRRIDKMISEARDELVAAPTKEARLEIAKDIEELFKRRNEMFARDKEFFESMDRKDLDSYIEKANEFDELGRRMQVLDEGSKVRERLEARATEVKKEITQIEEKYETQTEEKQQQEQAKTQPQEQTEEVLDRGVQQKETFTEREQEQQSEQDPEITEEQTDESEPESAQSRREEDVTEPVKLKYEQTETPQTFEEVDGGDRVYREAAQVFNKSLDRRTGEETATNNAVEYIQGTKAYEGANDVQREQMIRDFREQVGAREKKAPSVKKVTGVKPDKKITMTDKQLVKQRIQDMVKAANQGYRQARKEGKSFAESVGNNLKDLVKTGTLTSKQATSLARRAAGVSTERQLQKFNEYAGRLMERAEYQSDVSKARRARKRARKKQKANDFGIDDGSMKLALRTDPKDLSLEDLDRFNAFLEQSNKGAFDRSKVEDDINYFAEIADTQIKEAQSDEKEPKKSEANEETKKALISVYRGAIEQPISDVKEEYNQAYKDMRSLTDAELESLTVRELEELLQGYNNMRDGRFISTKANEALRDINAERMKGESVLVTDGKIFRTLLRDILQPFKFDKKRGLTLKERQDKRRNFIRQIPLNRLDFALKGKIGNNLYKTWIQPISLAYSTYDAESILLRREHDKLYNKVGKNKKQRKEEMVKIALIALAKEKHFNPKNQEVSTVEEYIEAIKEAAEKNESYRENFAQRYIGIYEGMLEDGKFDWESQENKLSKEGLEYLRFTEEVNEKNGDKVEVSAIRNGENVTVRKFYTPVSVALFEFSKLEDIKKGAKDFVQDENDPNLRATVRSQHVKARTKGGKPLYLEYNENFMRASRSVMQDFYMRETLRTTSKAFNKIKSDKELNDSQRAFHEGLEATLAEVTKNTFVNTYFEGGLGRKILEELRKRGYQNALASMPRAATELATNFLHAYTTSRTSLANGIDFSLKNQSDPDALKRMAELAGTTQFTRIFDKGESIMVEQGVGNLRSFTKYGKVIDHLNNKLISWPDRAIARSVWLGNFVTEFKTRTGQDFNIQKFNNDRTYREKFEQEVLAARDLADKKLSQGFASLNPYEGIVAAQVTRDDGIFSQFNKYMTRFMRFEYQSMMDSLQGLVGNNELTTGEALGLGVATVVRMSAYQFMMSTVMDGFINLVQMMLGRYDEDEEEDEDLVDLTKRSALGALLSIFAFRRLGNISKIPIAWGIEKLNKEFGEDMLLREGEYNPYENSMVFSTVPAQFEPYERGAVPKIAKVAPKIMGPYSYITNTMIKGTDYIMKGGIEIDGVVYLEPELKTREAIERNRRLFYKRILPELLINTIGLPAPRDVRGLMMEEVYKEYQNKKKKSKNLGDKELKFN